MATKTPKPPRKKSNCPPDKCKQYTTLGTSTNNAKTAFNIIRNAPKSVQTINGVKKRAYTDRTFAAQVPKLYATIRSIQASRKAGQEPKQADINALGGFVITWKSKYYKA